ncbi:MAG: 3-isopropylmalate dehydratase [Methanogenium sp.]|nr:3-isopropylmalate dehydratase [Methanogenium sp.]
MIKGTAVCIGEDIDTDMIIAGRYLRTKDRRVWAEHVFEDLNPGLAERLNGAVIIAGKNMGCGSSREQAPVALKEAGVVAVIAPTFARIFFRNAINVGLPLLQTEGISCRDGDEVTLSLKEGWAEVAGERYTGAALSPHMQDILDAGGLVPYWRSKR